MKPMRLIPPLTILAVSLAVGTAHADTGSPPLKGGSHCEMKLKPTYRLAAVVRHGMPIKVTCDGPARFFAMPDFAAMTPQSRDLTVIGGHTALTIGRTRNSRLTAAGTLTVRPRISKLGLKISRKYRRTKLVVGLGTEREDGAFWSSPGDWGRTVMVR
jgi:hypothetical protein